MTEEVGNKFLSLESPSKKMRKIDSWADFLNKLDEHDEKGDKSDLLGAPDFGFTLKQQQNGPDTSPQAKSQVPWSQSHLLVSHFMKRAAHGQGNQQAPSPNTFVKNGNHEGFQMLDLSQQMLPKSSQSPVNNSNPTNNQNSHHVHTGTSDSNHLHQLHLHKLQQQQQHPQSHQQASSTHSFAKPPKKRSRKSKKSGSGTTGNNNNNVNILNGANLMAQVGASSSGVGVNGNNNANNSLAAALQQHIANIAAAARTNAGSSSKTHGSQDEKSNAILHAVHARNEQITYQLQLLSQKHAQLQSASKKYVEQLHTQTNAFAAFKEEAAREIQKNRSEIQLLRSKIKRQEEESKKAQEERDAMQKENERKLKDKDVEIKKLRTFLKLAKSRIEIERRSVVSS
mmetsp:Transcript_2399/g.3474  ORF Transcript_2399/g.3474 Transcript_2399/m.3474 type:complete len:398 (-) Transcript_2399:8-1201(-)|eukprot:CAMPEP_0184487342 /NCGR_PEP_ID=MMETSP0113_2-20130426/9827_1 /TAXON_ID=91329 /ORGANISM="Norrisiella sphaerica, Strain BC52" /LENGTH=397 /DNA_ID=CAMNT_0026869615 /DNA_START=180 /DNA_END=1373 /DNA_ORIENTATION=-